MNTKGIFVTIEGMDGSGKTTVAALLAERMSREGLPTSLHAEPTHGPIGKLIRTLLTASPSERPGATTMALLFAADRREHGVEIQKILDAGTNVVCDRYILTSLVYQGADGLLESDVAQFNGFKSSHGGDLAKVDELTSPPLPTIHLIMDLPVEKAIERLERRSRALDRFESVGFLMSVRQRYLSFSGYRFPTVVVNADRCVEEIVEDCWNLVKTNRE